MVFNDNWPFSINIFLCYYKICISAFSITGGEVVRGEGGPPGPPMPRPVLPRERGYLDRFIEYLVGDGPANRFALVCRQCESHNGMALKDEFQYLGE